MNLLKAFFIGIRLGIPAQGMSHGHIRMFYKGIKGLDNEYYDQDKVKNWDKEIKTAFKELNAIFEKNEHIAQKIPYIDEIASKYSFLTNLNEYLIDIALIDFFAKSPNYDTEEYFESQEWLQIEDKLADRGTELLNWLLYINEAKSAQEKICLESYIEDFLLIGDEINDDQETLKLYEPLLDAQEYLAYTPLDLFLLYEKIPDSHELKNLFFPMICYFRDPEHVESTLLSTINCGGNVIEHGAVLACTLCATHGWQKFPDSYQKYFI